MLMTLYVHVPTPIHILRYVMQGDATILSKSYSWWAGAIHHLKPGLGIHLKRTPFGPYFEGPLWKAPMGHSQIAIMGPPSVSSMFLHYTPNKRKCSSIDSNIGPLTLIPYVVEVQRRKGKIYPFLEWILQTKPAAKDPAKRRIAEMIFGNLECPFSHSVSGLTKK